MAADSTIQIEFTPETLAAINRLAEALERAKRAAPAAPKVCWACNGTGRPVKDDPEACVVCNGTGVV